MADEQKAKRLEIAHVLFMDIVGYSKLLTDEQSEALQELNQIVRGTEAAHEAEAAGGLTILPTGDGMALVFTGSVEEPVECALEISQALRAEPSLPVRMGIHSGPIHHVTDANGRENIAGVGINIAQRVMDCGDAGHILVSKRVADDLAQQRRWQPYIHELGDVEMKHGVVVSLVNLYAETIGNPTPPSRLGKMRGGVRALSRSARKGLSPFARSVFIIVGLLIALIFVLAIVSVIFAPAIMRTVDQHRLATLPQPTATAPPSLADTIKSAVAKQITDELQRDFSHRKKAAAEPASTGSEIPEKSIAVLPFENLSDDKSNAYFAEGIQDEILTRLSKIADLKVISRTSTERYKSAPDSLREIGQQLGVANLLEGSVQKSGNAVHINVQLIKAATDQHVWAETYDRKLTDIFAVESEIAKTIAESLQAQLTGSEKSAISKKPTENLQAHELYLKGRYFWNRRNAASLRKAADYFQQAINLDPNYALAYAGLADVYSILPVYAGTAPKDDVPKALAAARKAVELDSNSAEAHTALGNALVSNGQLKLAEPEFRRALELNPNYATAHQWLAECLFGQGRFPESLAENERAHELDPLSLIINASYASSLSGAGRYDDAIKQARKALELDPNLLPGHEILGQTYEAEGMLEEAIAEYRKANELEPTPSNFAMLAYAYAETGRMAETRKILDKLTTLSAQRYVGAYPLAIVHLALGEKEEALRLLEQSFIERDILLQGLFGSIKIDKRLDPLRNDPRFQKLVERFDAGIPE
jgi:TolB-like protein/Flp pilus assembly protein TadD